MSDGPRDEEKPSAWQRLRRRKVVQWGMAYVAGAWGFLQGLEYASGVFDWPRQIQQVATIALLTGLPMVLVLAWYHGDRGVQRIKRGEVAILALLLAIGAYAVLRAAREASVPSNDATDAFVPRPASKADQRRLAILPFDNLGGDPANAAFVGGVHDTLITQVSKIPGLSVISRSSVLQFTGKHPTIREVAAALGVGTVLEGSVAREGNRLRVQAQLIDAGTDAHLWAETYDRNTDDLFAVQSDIAQAVADQLRIRLSGDEARRLSASLSSNPRAYEHYVLGRDYVGRSNWPDAIRELTTAITMDPGFADAYAYLSMARTWQGFMNPSGHADNVNLAREAAEKALELDPSSPEGHLAMAIFLYRGDPDIDRAAQEFERAVAGLPNDALALGNFALLRRWQGRWEDTRALAARAAEIDPQGTAPDLYVTTLVALGRRDEANRAAASAIKAQPDNVELATYPGEIARNFSCDLGTATRVAHDVAARFPDDPIAVGYLALLALQTGDAKTALDLVDRLPDVPDRHSSYEGALTKILIERTWGNSRAADEVIRANLQSIDDELRDLPPAAVPYDSFAWSAVYHALQGGRAEAHSYVERAFDSLPETGDAANRSYAHYLAAIAFAWTGDSALALEHVRQELDSPGLRRPAYFWCDPFLAPMRSDPEFRALLADRGANTSIDPLQPATWPHPP